MPKRIYYTLVVREGGVWAPQFGDYNRSVVATELVYLLDGHDAPKRRDTKIIRSGVAKAEVDAEVAKLNAEVA